MRACVQPTEETLSMSESGMGRLRIARTANVSSRTARSRVGSRSASVPSAAASVNSALSSLSSPRASSSPDAAHTYNNEHDERREARREEHLNMNYIFNPNNGTVGDDVDDDNGLTAGTGGRPPIPKGKCPLKTRERAALAGWTGRDLALFPDTKQERRFDLEQREACIQL